VERAVDVRQPVGGVAMVAQNIINAPYLTTYFVTTGIDFKTVADTTLFTVPAGRSFVIIGSILEATNFDTPTIAGAFNVGTNGAAYDNITNGDASTTLVTGTSLLYTTGGNSPIVVPAGGVVKLSVTLGVTAVAAVGNFYIYGILK